MPYLRCAASIGLILMLAPALSARAQAPVSPDPPAVLVESVTVTAAKRNSDAATYPGSIQILDSRFLKDRRAVTTDEMTRFVPNLFYKKAVSGDAFVARGISTIDTALFSPMGLYINDVACPLSYMQSQSLLDVARVEVLRGPQSTLYGKNSSSGVINLVLDEPDNAFRARFFASAGSYHAGSGGVSASGPILRDTLFWGMCVEGQTTDGYLENQVTGRDNVGNDQRLFARASLKWAPTDRFSAALVINGQDRESGVSTLRFEDGPWATNRYKVYSNEADQADQDSLGQTLRIRSGLGRADLTSITSHERFNRDFLMDFDRTPVALGAACIDLTQDQWTQEFRLAGGDESEPAWLVGLYASQEEQDATWSLNHVNPMMANQRVTDSDIRTAALFGQSTFPLTPRLRATAGLRLDRFDGSGRQAHSQGGTTRIYDRDLSETQWLPMASLAYDLSPLASTYITFSTGWLAGGYDSFSASSRETFAYDPEFTRNYEAGIKARFFGDRVQTAFSVFYTEIDDKQVKEEVPGGGPGVWRYTNAASAHTRGFELAVTAFALDHLELVAGIGYARSRIDNWTGTAGGRALDYSGKALPWAPAFTASLGAGYYPESGFYAGADLFLAGKQYFDAANTLEDDGYALVNLRAGYRLGSLDLSVWCHNLGDTQYADKKVKTQTGHTQIEDGAPRTYGMSLNWRF